ncbi:MAG TPA: hypothetical protein VFK85_09080 [Anaeromyxobacteraceae bacterium]|nr:hypothetical protein [Anaeromyxobacteraceae bacterium]
MATPGRVPAHRRRSAIAAVTRNALLTIAGGFALLWLAQLR